MPFGFDLFVSVPDEKAKLDCERIFLALPKLQKLVVEIVPNQGRDIGPMLVQFGGRLAAYDVVCHVHSKKSTYANGITDGWLDYLLDSLLGTGENIRRVFQLLLVEDFGMVYPQPFSSIPIQACTWLATETLAPGYVRRFGVSALPNGMLSFPTGSMFWARGDAIGSMLTASIDYCDFPAETGQIDGTLAHAVERLLGAVPQALGYKAAVIADPLKSSWSEFRVDEYFASINTTSLKQAVSDPAIKLVIVDLFDTLVTRPSIDPEIAKSIAARTAHGLQDGDALQEIEARLEVVLAERRLDILDIIREAGRGEKEIVIVSDTMLDLSVLYEILARVGMDRSLPMYASSAGVRKDQGGALFRHILAAHAVTAAETIIVGDHPRNDWYIPRVLGLKTFHVFRPADIASSSVRFRPVLERYRHAGVDEQLTLGPVVNEAWRGMDFPNAKPDDLFLNTSPALVGFCVLGPLLASFSQWLMDRAASLGVDMLSFSGRDGQALKWAYDEWSAGIERAPRTRYVKHPVRGERNALSIDDGAMSILAAFDCVSERERTSSIRRRFSELENLLGALGEAVEEEADGNGAARRDLKAGALRYLKRAIEIRSSVDCSFKPSLDVAGALFEAFVDEASADEWAFLSNIGS